MDTKQGGRSSHLEMEDRFEYASLDPSTSEIRLLILENGQFDDPIQCHVYHVYLDEKPSYEALSYVWGDTTATRDIRVSGHRFAVTVNLEVALRSLRLFNEPRHLWIDAICINQNDVLERNSQVQRMRDIYTSASSVLSWLGEASEDSGEAMAEIEDIARLFQKNAWVVMMHTATPELFDALEFNFEGRNWGAVFDLLAREYWTRVWIIQELASSGPMHSFMKEDGILSRGVIGCGSIWMSKHLFDIFVRLISYLGREINNFRPPPGLETEIKEPVRTMLLRNPIPAMQMFRALAIAKDEPHIIRVLLATTAFKATDPRDKVFALLGMTNKVSGFSPDYSCPVQQMYKELMSSVILQDRSLNCLRRNGTVEVDFSPSWAIPNLGALQIGAAWDNDNGFNYASGHRESDAYFDRGLNLLRCSGVLIGSLKTVIGPMGGEESSAHTTLHVFAKNMDPANREKLWRTFVMDQDIFDSANPVSPAPPEFAMQYEVMRAERNVPRDFEPEAPEELRRVRFVERYLRNFDECITSRCVFVTESGYLGLGPYLTIEGDVVAVLTGADFCFVLRPKEDCYELVGEAYVHGVMKGELMDGDENGNLVNGREFAIC